MLTFLIGYYKIASSTNRQESQPMYTDVLADYTEENLREIEAIEDYE